MSSCALPSPDTGNDDVNQGGEGTHDSSSYVASNGTAREVKKRKKSSSSTGTSDDAIASFLSTFSSMEYDNLNVPPPSSLPLLLPHLNNFTLTVSPEVNINDLPPFHQLFVINQLSYQDVMRQQETERMELLAAGRNVKGFHLYEDGSVDI